MILKNTERDQSAEISARRKEGTYGGIKNHNAKSNCAGFMIIFGKVERAKFENIRDTLSDSVCRRYNEARTYRDGKWVIFFRRRFVWKLKKLIKLKSPKAIDLIWAAFLQFEAPDYSEEGVQSFKDFIEDKEMISTLEFWGAYDNRELKGVIATNENRRHI